MNTALITSSPLCTLAQHIRDWQLSHGISDSDLCRRYIGLGSTKTYKRILDGDQDELDLDRWTADYHAVWSLIEMAIAAGDVDEPDYDDLNHVVRARLAVADAIGEKGNNRLVIIEGPSGAGKTTAARCIAGRFGRAVALCEADETWKSVNAALGGLLRAVGCRDLPASGEARRERLVEILRATPLCLTVDEAHHMGPGSLNMIKTILNQTAAQIVFLCIPTLMRKLESTAFEEARQLTKNRLCERVKLEAPSVKDVEKFLDRRLKMEDAKTLSACASALAGRAATLGCWNFVNQVARRARKLAGKEAVDQETFARALAAAAATR